MRVRQQWLCARKTDGKKVKKYIYIGIFWGPVGVYGKRARRACAHEKFIYIYNTKTSVVLGNKAQKILVKLPLIYVNAFGGFKVFFFGEVEDSRKLSNDKKALLKLLFINTKLWMIFCEINSLTT